MQDHLESSDFGRCVFADYFCAAARDRFLHAVCSRRGHCHAGKSDRACAGRTCETPKKSGNGFHDRCRSWTGRAYSVWNRQSADAAGNRIYQQSAADVGITGT